LSHISRISKQDRLLLSTQQIKFEKQQDPENLPERCLRIKILDTMKMRFTEIKFCCALACQAEIEIVSLKDHNLGFIVDCILEQLKHKEVTLIVNVSENIDSSLLKNIKHSRIS